MELRSVGLFGGSKTGEQGEKPSEQGENQQQTQSTRDGESWEASAYPQRNPCSFK